MYCRIKKRDETGVFGEYTKEKAATTALQPRDLSVFYLFSLIYLHAASAATAPSAAAVVS